MGAGFDTAHLILVVYTECLEGTGLCCQNVGFEAGFGLDSGSLVWFLKRSSP